MLIGFFLYKISKYIKPTETSNSVRIAEQTVIFQPLHPQRVLAVCHVTVTYCDVITSFVVSRAPPSLLPGNGAEKLPANIFCIF